MLCNHLGDGRHEGGLVKLVGLAVAQEEEDAALYDVRGARGEGLEVSAAERNRWVVQRGRRAGLHHRGAVAGALPACAIRGHPA